MGHNESDMVLVQRARCGESAAFGKIVARYQKALLSVARTWLGSADDAADAVQDALILAYVHLNQLHDPNRLGAWLRRVTVNACRRRIRARKPTASLDALREAGMDDTNTTDTRLLVAQAMACLSTETRLTVTLYYQREMSLEEIAAFQEVPITTIKSRLRNARAQLRKELETALEETIPSTAKDITPQVLRRIEAAGRIGSMALSPDGAILVTGVALEVTETKFDARIAAWEIATGNPLWTTDLTSWFRTILFTPDGHSVLIATGLPGRRDGLEGRILFLDATTGEEVREIKTTSGAFGLALSPSGKSVAAGQSEGYTDYRSHGDKGVARLYDLATGDPIQVFEPHFNHVHTVAFSPDGKTLATGAGDNKVRLFDPATGQLNEMLEGPTDSVRTLAFTPDGTRLLAADDTGAVHIWQLH